MTGDFEIERRWDGSTETVPVNQAGRIMFLPLSQLLASGKVTDSPTLPQV